MTIALRKLEDVCSITMGQAPEGVSYNDKGIGLPLIAGAGDFGREHPAAKKFTSAPTKTCANGDIVMSIRATIGTKVLSDGVFCLGRGVAGLRPTTELHARYLWHWLGFVEGKLTAKGRGATFPQVSRTDIGELEIPLPPLDEQKRIAAILDKADALRRKRKRALDLLDGLARSIFLEMFGDPESNPKGWKRGVIGDLLEGTQYGTSDKAGEKGKYPILRMGNITSDGKTDFDDLKYIDLDDKDLDKFTLRRGDILFNRTNSADLVGKTAVFDRDEPFAFAGYLVRARARSGVSPHYISGYLNSRHGKATLRNMAKSIVGMANINAKEMQAIPILVPDAQTQNVYSKRLSAIETSRFECHRHLQSLDTLFSSLQSRAFSGQL